MAEKVTKTPRKTKSETVVNDYLPGIYQDFIQHYPNIGLAYDKLADVCYEGGPLNKKTCQLIKLGVAIGLNSEGAVRSHARRALQDGATVDEIRHVVLLSFTTAGFPAVIAGYKWVEEVIAKNK
jgi:4-carboxymuconolactone decarboxylase